VRTLNLIEHDGRAAAVVVDGQALLDATLGPTARRHVQAKCLHALEIAAGDRPGPYNDAAATRYAREVLDGPGR